MPPQPPEETAVLSHQPVQDPEQRLGVHPKDPLAYAEPHSLGLKPPHRHGTSLSTDYNMMAQARSGQDQAPQRLGHYRHYSLRHFGDSGQPQSGYNGYHPAGLSPPESPEDTATTRTKTTIVVNGAKEDTLCSPNQAGINRGPVEYGGKPEKEVLGMQHHGASPGVRNASLHAGTDQSGFTQSNYTSPMQTVFKTPFCLMKPVEESNTEANGHQHYRQTNQPKLLDPGAFHAPPSTVHHNNSPYDKMASPLPSANGHYRDRHPTPLGSPMVSCPFDVQDAALSAAAASLTDQNSSQTRIAQKYGLKSSPVSLWKKALWIVFTLSIFFLPYCILKACFHVQVSAGAWQTSVTYGMLMAVDFMAVISFSALNRRRVNQRVKKRDPHWVGMSTGILAVGYREDPVLLEGCLKSLRAIRYQRNQRVLLVVDGNEPQDEYMAQIFLRVFEKQGPAVFRPDFLCMDRAASDRGREDLVRQIAYHPGPVCVMQPHRGKRSAMYTGFAALLQQGIESVVVTDSDTYLDPHVCRELVFALAESPIIGAATGDVRIYNTGTWVSFLSSIRYWFAFNLERGAQSYHSVVNCVSGPLGIYRMSIIADVMDNWVRQSFLGVLCTYGDDRHLTNLVLREGFKVKFSHYAICYTDTPIRFIAWVTQQTRWSKSFFREIPIQLGCIHLHSPWMTYALLYQLIYPMMMIYSLVNCIYFGTGAQISSWVVSIVFVGILKTAYALRVTGDKKFFFTTVYGFLYMLGYVPAKIFAALTLYDNSWGTSARLIRNFTQLQSYIAPVTWSVVLAIGVFHNPSRYSQRTPLAEGQSPPIFSDAIVIQSLICLGLGYLVLYFWFFVKTGVLKRDYRRDFSYEELFEHMTSYTMVDGGRRKVARFEV
ncbi:Hyaluronan synthase 3 [Lunasporangiospora selenospora]|uniref:Hyaluronan synthase 3 n=1 Tax=Lunasporangiospora selenospora TaxID=979761 RepID=A0A9P6FVR7_9FUNG|nr:Hyaluronan synthase 3 [Lunasporangiospora selenospora]